MEDDPLKELSEQYSQDIIDTNIKKFINKLKKYDVLEVLIQLVGEVFVCANNSEENIAEDYRMMISYIQSIYASNIFTDNLSCSKEAFKELTKDCKDIIDSCRIAESLDTNIDEAGIDFSSILYEISSGKTYPVLAPWILENLLSSQGNLLKESYGITIDDVIRGMQNIINALCQIASNAINGQTLSKDMLLVRNITNWPQSFIDDLSFKNGTAKDFSSREKFANWFNIEMPTKQKPFIKIDGESYLFEFSIVFDNLYRAIQKAVCNQNNCFKEVWKENQQKASEDFASILFTHPLIDSFCYLNNYYKLEKGKWIENDALVIYKNVLFIMEVKAGSFTPKSIFIDSESHSKAKKSLIDTPVFQGERLINKLNVDKEIEIFDKTHKNKVCILKKDDFKHIIPIAVTVEPLGEILSMYRNKENLKFLPISIEDLAVYSVFFENEPIFFIHYLIERVRDINVKSFMINDELDFLGGYLSNRNFNNRYNHMLAEEGLENNGVGGIWIDNMHEELDRYFASAMNIEKPKFNVSNFVYELIKSFEKNLDANCLNLALIILDQDDTFHKSLNDCVFKIINKQAVTKKFASVMLFFEDNPNFIPIQLFANDIDNICATEEKARIYSLATMEARGYDSIYYLIININQGSISSTVANCLNKDDFKEVDMREIDFLQMYIQTTSTPFNLLERTKEKRIGRNDPCPCGSGKKYKKCCIGKNK